MKIAEMEEHHRAYEELEAAVRNAVKHRAFEETFQHSRRCWEHIDGALQFRKKRNIQPVLPPLASITEPCRYAPVLFEHDLLLDVEQFVRGTRPLAKCQERDFPGEVAQALEREQIAWKLWNHIEEHPGCWQWEFRSHLGVEQGTAVQIVENWEEMGIVRRQKDGHSFHVSMSTQLESSVTGICPRCGARVTARKRVLFQLSACPACKTIVSFCIEPSTGKQTA